VNAPWIFVYLKWHRGKLFGIAKRSEIVTLHREGFSVRHIAEKVAVKKSTVHLTIGWFQERGNLEDLKRPGPSRFTSATDDQIIKLISKRNRRFTALEITADFNRGRQSVSVRSGKKALTRSQFTDRCAVEKPEIRHWRTEKACCGLTNPNTKSSAKNVELLAEETRTKKCYQQ
jgi:transposase